MRGGPSWASGEVWTEVEKLAASFERVNRQPANLMRIGAAVARVLEPDEVRRSGAGPVHPPHMLWQAAPDAVRTGQGGRVWSVAWPDKEPGRWAQWRRERACARDGGHFWHPGDAMILWFCCRCGKDTDGWPKDGR